MLTSATKFDTWVAANPVREEMYWKGAAEGQFERFSKFAEDLGEPLTVISTHRSKSIDLPVGAIRVKNGWLVIRDNFHDICLGIIWDFAPKFPLAEVTTPLDWDWYLAEMEKKRNYSFGGWTDEEMDDPRILRVMVSNGSNEYWKKVSPEEKDRWLARMENPEWMSRDWSSGKLLCEGPFGPGCKLYKLPHGYCEGFERGGVPSAVTEVWEPGKTMGHFCLWDMDQALVVAKTLMAAESVDG